MLRRRQDEVLHQRERELTALKGALKEEVECHDKEMETLREQYSQDMDNLRMTMEQFTQVDGTMLCTWLCFKPLCSTGVRQQWFIKDVTIVYRIEGIKQTKWTP